jgi:hypothetical protein
MSLRYAKELALRAIQNSRGALGPISNNAIHDAKNAINAENNRILNAIIRGENYTGPIPRGATRRGASRARRNTRRVVRESPRRNENIISVSNGNNVISVSSGNSVISVSNSDNNRGSNINAPVYMNLNSD